MRQRGAARRRARAGQQQREQGDQGRQVEPPLLLPPRSVPGRRDRLQFRQQRGRAVRAGPGVLGEAGEDQRADRVRRQFGRDRGLGVLDREFGEGRAAVGAGAGEALEEGDGRGVDVARRGGGATGPLLGRHVGGGAGDVALVAARHRDPEVHQLGRPGGVHQHVGGLVVAVHHPGAVRGGQAEQRALQHHQRSFGGGGPLRAEQLAQGDAVHQLHHDGRAALALDVLVEPGDVRGVESGQDLGLGPERGGAGRAVQVLDRHGGAGRPVPGEHHPATGAGAELALVDVLGEFPGPRVRGLRGVPRSGGGAAPGRSLLLLLPVVHRFVLSPFTARSALRRRTLRHRRRCLGRGR